MSRTRGLLAPACLSTRTIPNARLVADVDLPTPPLWFVSTNTRVIAVPSSFAEHAFPRGWHRLRKSHVTLLAEVCAALTSGTSRRGGESRLSCLAAKLTARSRTARCRSVEGIELTPK